MKNHTPWVIGIMLMLLFVTKPITAQTPTWADNIATIMYNNCTSCHHAGGLAPNPLMTYAESYAFRFQIKQYVNDGYMPPWPPNAGYKHLAFERILSDGDKTKISDWVLGGAPEGNTANAPVPPVYANTSSALPSIDFTAKMPDYTVNTSTDLYRCFVINTNFANDQFASEIEIKPGNSAIVHHVLLYEDSTMMIRQLDSADAGAGYTNFYGTGSDASNLIGEWVPGTQHIKFPNGMGVRLKRNTRLIMQVHYPKGTYLKMDSTRVNIKFASNTSTNTFPPFREVALLPVLNEGGLINGPLVIPPNVVKTFTSVAVASSNPQPPLPFYTLLSIAPHMHLIGKEMKVFGIAPGGNDTMPFIHIPKWDFKWQGVYNFRNPMKVPVGTTLIAQSAYDNTSSNPSNPSSPPVIVTQGESTTNEMMLVFFAFTYYLPGDENIVVDNSPVVGINELQKDMVSSLQVFNVYPNPVKGNSQLNYFSPLKAPVKVTISSIEGKVVKEWNSSLEAGYGTVPFNTDGLAKGQYFINLQSKSFSKTKTFIVYE